MSCLLFSFLETLLLLLLVVGLIESSLQHKLNCENFTMNS